MNDTASSDLLNKLIQEKYSLYKSRLFSLLSVMADNDQGKKLTANSELLDASNDLASVLASVDRPNWLNETIGFTQEFKNQNKTPESIMSGSSWSLLQRAMKIFPQATNHLWEFGAHNNNDAYDFDLIYKKYRENSDLTNLFNSLIDTLNKMINSGEIDSIKAISSLNDLIATLSQNKDSSYFSTMASWEFVKNFTKNYAWQQIDNIPGVKTFKKSFEKTMADMDMEMDKLHNDISEELRNKYNMTIQSTLTYKKDKTLLIESDGDNN